MKSPTIEPMAVARLRPFAGNARTHSKKQIRQIADSIARFGFTNPILIDGNGIVVAGHGRLEAAKLLGLQQVPSFASPASMRPSLGPTRWLTTSSPSMPGGD